MAHKANVRKINVTGGSQSYLVTLPKDEVSRLHWRKGQKVVIERAGETLVIRDWKPPKGVNRNKD